MNVITRLEYAKDLFKLLSTEEKIRVANILSKVDEISVSDISEIVQIEQSMTSRYLGDLRKNRLAGFRRDAQTNFYSLYSDAKHLFQHMLEPFQELPEIQSDNQKLIRAGF